MGSPQDQLRTSRWLDDVRQGRKGAMAALLPVVYAELKRVAHAYMRREFKGRTLQTTALVHEAYLRLIDVNRVNWQSRNQFYAVSARMMRWRRPILTLGQVRSQPLVTSRRLS